MCIGRSEREIGYRIKEGRIMIGALNPDSSRVQEYLQKSKLQLIKQQKRKLIAMEMDF